MVNQQELEYAGARFDDVWRLSVHDHAVGARRRARRLQLRHLLYLDDAYAAGAVDTEAGVIAVVGKLDAVLEGRLKDCLAFFDRQFPSVDGDLDRVHSLSNSSVFREGNLACQRTKMAGAASSSFTLTPRTGLVTEMRRVVTCSSTEI